MRLCGFCYNHYIIAKAGVLIGSFKEKLTLFEWTQDNILKCYIEKAFEKSK